MQFAHLSNFMTSLCKVRGRRAWSRCLAPRSGSDGSTEKSTFAGYVVTGGAAPPLAAKRWCARQQARIGQAVQFGAALPVHTVAPSSIIACHCRSTTLFKARPDA